MAHWTFLTNHAQVLLCITQNSQITAREIASKVSITERAVQGIVNDLEDAGYLTRSRDGRKNRYQVHLDTPMRHTAQQHQPIRALIEVLLPRQA